jgi:hypothetical protein
VFHLLRSDGESSQVLGACQIALVLIQRRLAARRLGFGLIERILKAPLIDAKERLSLSYLLIILNKDVTDEPGHVGGHGHNVGADAAIARPWFEHVVTPELPADHNGHPDHNQRDQHPAGRSHPSSLHAPEIREPQPHMSGRILAAAAVTRPSRMT